MIKISKKEYERLKKIETEVESRELAVNQYIKINNDYTRNKKKFDRLKVKLEYDARRLIDMSKKIYDKFGVRV